MPPWQAPQSSCLCCWRPRPRWILKTSTVWWWQNGLTSWNSSCVYMDTNNQNKSLIRIKMFHISMSRRFWPNMAHLKRISIEGGGLCGLVFRLMIHVHTCSDCVSLVGVKWSSLHMSAWRLEDREARGVFLSALLWTVSLPWWLGHLHYHCSAYQHFVQLTPCNGVLSQWREAGSSAVSCLTLRW